MNKFLLLFGSAIGFTDAAFAGSFEFSGSGMAGEYFGIMETRRGNNLDNMPSRAVFVPTANLKALTARFLAAVSVFMRIIPLSTANMTKITPTGTGVFSRICWARMTVSEN